MTGNTYIKYQKQFLTADSSSSSKDQMRTNSIQPHTHVGFAQH